MGNKSSKKESDDGCIGNRRVRTIVLSIVLVAFFIFAMAWIEANYSTWKDFDDSIFGNFTDYYESMANAWLLIMISGIICIVGTIAAVVLFLVPGCDDKMGKVAGFVMLIGGILYIAGWIWKVVEERNYIDEWFGLDNLPDDTKTQMEAQWAAEVGEAILAGGATLLLGMDAAFQLFDDEDKRLGSNLGLICIVSVLCMNCYYLQVCDDDDDSITAVLCVQPDGVVAIATGYLVLWITTLVFIILYICSCCTCNCKDKCLVRFLLAVALVIGGVITAIGYYTYAGNYESSVELNPDSDDSTGKLVAYYIGFTILVGGLPIIWALDIALDDVKNSKDYKK